MARLLGVDLNADDRRMALLNCIHGWRDDDEAALVAAPELQPLASTCAAPEAKLSADGVLAEARQIIAGASDTELGEIDWSCEPQSDREGALRHAVIARVDA